MSDRFCRATRKSFPKRGTIWSKGLRLSQSGFSTGNQEVMLIGGKKQILATITD